MLYIYIVHIIDYINILYMTYIPVLYIIITKCIVYMYYFMYRYFSNYDSALYKPDKP